MFTRHKRPVALIYFSTLCLLVFSTHHLTKPYNYLFFIGTTSILYAFQHLPGSLSISSHNVPRLSSNTTFSMKPAQNLPLPPPQHTPRGSITTQLQHFLSLHTSQSIYQPNGYYNYGCSPFPPQPVRFLRPPNFSDHSAVPGHPATAWC